MLVLIGYFVKYSAYLFSYLFCCYAIVNWLKIIWSTYQTHFNKSQILPLFSHAARIIKIILYPNSLLLHIILNILMMGSLFNCLMKNWMCIMTCPSTILWSQTVNFCYCLNLLSQHNLAGGEELINLSRKRQIQAA